MHTPIGENVDWRLSATIAPCHVTVLFHHSIAFSVWNLEIPSLSTAPVLVKFKYFSQELGRVLILLAGR